MSPRPRLLAVTLLLAAYALSAFTRVAGAAPPPEALQGFDPVLLVEGEDMLGEESLTADHGGLRYYFSSAETRERFLADPARFTPQYEGACARMLTADGNPDLFAIHEGKIYLFGSDHCHRAFTAAPEDYLAAEPEPLPDDPAARERGEALIARAAAAVGGERLDRIESYQETAVRVENEAEVAERLVFLLPDRARIEREHESGTVSTVLVAGGGFTSSPAGVRPLSGFQSRYHARDLARHPLAILHARAEDGFRAAALGRGEADGREIERVGVTVEGERLTLGIDPQSGRPVSVSFRADGPRGIQGEIEVLYDDWRMVDGLLVPFGERYSFEGEPFRTRTVRGVRLDAGVAPSLFEPPTGGTGAEGER